ncbi:MAG: acetate kinase [Lachnospiraceae bacterium]|nr:acetate kinase [Lachnospiraceae bacterium]
MKILVINCGSSSLKYQLIDSGTEKALATGICERIGQSGHFKYSSSEGAKIEFDKDMPDHKVAVSIVLDALVDEKNGVVKTLDEIEAIGHRVVHGGEKFSSSVVVDESVIADVEAVSELAPLHNPAGIIGIRACQAIMPGKPNVAVFDTAFHQTMPKKAYMYGLPVSYYDKYKIRRYGFHGTSHSYVSKRTYEVAGLDAENSKVIVCHLGSGASISAVMNGKSVDTSMGLTPLEGLVMGTRSGDIDPAIVEFIAHKENKSVEDVMTILNKESGVYGLSGGLSSDFRDLEKAASEGNALADEAQRIFSYRVVKYIGAYTAAMNGVDAITFTAGLGENNKDIRKEICDYLGFLGIVLDDEKNSVRGEDIVVSAPESKVKVCVIPTNEELAIARETAALIK